MSKLISNEISKYKLKGTADNLFHRISLTVADSRNYIFSQSCTDYHKVRSSDTALGSEPTLGKVAKSLCKDNPSIPKVILQIRHINAGYELNSLLSFMLEQKLRPCAVSEHAVCNYY